MSLIAISRASGVLLLAMLWLIFYVRERHWWIMLVGGLGILVLVTGLFLGSHYESLSNSLSLAYIFLGVSVAIMARTTGFRPARPITLSTPVIVSLVVIGFIIIGATGILLAKLIFS